MKDTFLTLAAPATGEFKDRGSKFIAYAFPIESEADWHSRLDEVRKEHPKARHYCFAFRLGQDGLHYRANDDGEPAGSAGRPILGQIDSFGLSNVFVVVVRYFGGTLLGVPGLIAAYKGSTQNALQQAEIVEKTIMQSFRIQFDYGLMSQVMNAVKKLSFDLVEQEFGETDGSVVISIRKSEADQKILEFKALSGNLHLEQAALAGDIPGLMIEWV